jgi:ankyrin repeat protein
MGKPSLDAFTTMFIRLAVALQGVCMCMQHIYHILPSCTHFLQMLQQGCDVNCCDYDGRTGLMLAASNGNTTAVKLLLMAGAVVNASDNMGGSALLEACKGGHDETIQ